jgi:hypothetical protein
VLNHAATVLDMAADCAAGSAESETSPPAVAKPLRVLCIARDETDRLGHRMLQSALDEYAFDFEVCSTDLLVSESVERIARARADLVCIGSTPPAPAHAAKLLCRRLRKRVPLAHIVVARWGGEDDNESEGLRAAGASGVHTSIDQLRLTLIAAASSLQAAIEPHGPELEPPAAPLMAGG